MFQIVSCRKICTKQSPCYIRGLRYISTRVTAKVKLPRIMNTNQFRPWRCWSCISNQLQSKMKFLWLRKVCTILLSNYFTVVTPQHNSNTLFGPRVEIGTSKFRLKYCTAEEDPIYDKVWLSFDPPESNYSSIWYKATLSWQVWAQAFTERLNQLSLHSLQRAKSTQGFQVGTF